MQRVKTDGAAIGIKYRCGQKMIKVNYHGRQHDKRRFYPKARIVCAAPDDPRNQKWRDKMAGIVDEGLEHLIEQLHLKFVILNLFQDLLPVHCVCRSGS